jgi:hypothetical protein
MTMIDERQMEVLPRSISFSHFVTKVKGTFFSMFKFQDGVQSK